MYFTCRSAQLSLSSSQQFPTSDLHSSPRRPSSHLGSITAEKTLLETLSNVGTRERRQSTAEFLLQKEPEVTPSPRVRQQLPEAEGPPLHAHLCGDLRAVANTEEA